MKNFLRQILKPKYETFNRLEIKADNILHNWQYLKSRQPTAALFPVLKSNAYGHGLKEVAQILNRTDAPLAVVDSYPEAQIVYDYFKGRVLILGEMPLGAYRYCRFKRTEFVVYNEKTLRELSRYGRQARVHLFVNTGMNREGIKDWTAFIKRNLKYLSQVEISGLCSHLASAEEDSPLNREQLKRFKAALGELRQAGFFPRWVHLGNSAAALTLREDFLTAYRPGLAFYGYSPFQDRRAAESLRPALEIYSRLVSVQEINAGESVSYNEIYRVKQKTKIGLLPFGYFEGLNLRLSNRAEFLVKGEFGQAYCRLAGRVCMNLSSLDLGHCQAEAGDEVQIVSSDSLAPNSIYSLANISEMIVYEFLVKLNSNIRREVL